jgi:beta-phosphoglucomutase-like phosphatase (HAD superfamily)
MPNFFKSAKLAALVVVDIDGTCSDFSERSRNAGPEPSRDDKPNYLAWLSRLQDEARLAADQPVPGMREVVRALASQNRLYYLTGREEQYRNVTRAWLAANGFPERPLICRQPDDWRSATEMKMQVISELRKDGQPVVVLDDAPESHFVSECLKHGFTLLKACSGGTP